MPLFTTPHSWHLVSITLPTPSLSAQRELNIRDRTRLSTNTLHQLHAESVVKTDTQTSKWAFPLTFNHIPFVVAVIVAVCGPVVNVEALDRSVVVTRGTILEGNGKKDYVRLQAIWCPIIILRQEIFHQLMVGHAISRCTVCLKFRR